MPVDLKIVNGIICLTCTGNLSSDDLWRACDLYAKIEAEAETTPDRMADISLVDKVELDFGAVEAVAAVRRVAPLKNQVKSGIVATRPVLYGFARMFQTLNDNPKIVVELFRDTESCWVWLTGKPMAPSDVTQVLGRQASTFQSPRPPLQ